LQLRRIFVVNQQVMMLRDCHENTVSEFWKLILRLRNSVVANISQPINRRYVDLNHDLNQSQCIVTELAARSAACRSSASAVAKGHQYKQ